MSLTREFNPFICKVIIDRIYYCHLLVVFCFIALVANFLVVNCLFPFSFCVPSIGILTMITKVLTLNTL